LGRPMFAAEAALDARWRAAAKSRYSVGDAHTPLEIASTRTRFRELEEDIAKNGEAYVTRPWKVSVEGECLKPRVFDIDDLLGLAPIEERVYRMLCTEGFLHIVPYLGYPLAELLRRVEPTGNAKFIEFTSVFDPARLRGQREITYISWPYVEGLRMDEAMHPLTLVALGAYGQELPKGLGAPLAVRVPWKFGTKSPKAVVRMRLVEKQPATIWNTRYPERASFWGNINPAGATNLLGRGQRERRDGDILTRPTPLYNGYAEHVAALYTGMNPAEMY
jgi:methionine sulfoxide reductase catalytic subunit